MVVLVKRIRGSTDVVSHSAKGSEWEEHKYIKKIDGDYYYPDNYKGGRHLENNEDDKKISTDSDLDPELIDAAARDVIKGLFGNGVDRKMTLGDAYQKIQDRVNEILRSNSGSVKISSEEAQKASEDGKKAVTKVKSSAAASMDMNQIYSAYGGLENKKNFKESKRSRQTNVAKRR